MARPLCPSPAPAKRLPMDPGRRHWWRGAAALALVAGGGAAALLGSGAAGPAGGLLARAAGGLVGRGGAVGAGRRAELDAPPAEVCVVAPPIAWQPSSGLPMRAARPVPADARCPVCGMYPARSPRWAAQVIYADGAVHFFDSPLSLHRFLQDVPRYSPGRDRAGLLALWVMDFDQGFWTNAGTAFHVLGSDASGPMRAGNLPAFASPAAAQRFADAHGGRVLPASAIDAAMLKGLGVAGGHAH